MKILIITPYSRDANSFWRCMGPMSYLAKTSAGEVEIELPTDGMQLSWDRICRYDAIFMHRPCRKDDLTVMQIAKNCNIPVWIDYDDWLFNIPEWNPCRGSYHNSTVQHLMAHITSCADVVSVTTSALAEALSCLNKNIVIVPNSYRSDMFPWRLSPPKREVTFMWRGSNTHDGDLLSVKEGLKSLPDKLNVVGALPYTLSSEMKPDSYTLIPHQDALIYWEKLYELAPKFMVFPLHEIFFNHCKSNIAWLESCHAGALTIAPDMAEWRQPGVITYKANNSESFKKAIDTAMAMPEKERREQADVAFEFMKSKYDISEVNKIRMKICKAITSPGFKKNQNSPYDQAVGIIAMGKLQNQTRGG